MSILKQFHNYPWVVIIVFGLLSTFIVGLLYSSFWEIMKCRVLNFWYRICPCLERVAHPSKIDKRKRESLDWKTEIKDRLKRLEDGQAEQRQTLNALLAAISLEGIIVDQPPMEVSRTPLVGDMASSGSQPSNSTTSAYVTLSLPRGTPIMVWTCVTNFLRRVGGGPRLSWRGSIVIQARLSIDSYILAEIGELVKKCCSVDIRFTLQIASWGIFYYNGGIVHLHILKEGDVPINVEASWNKKRIGIFMRGLYLNGAQIKVTTEHTSTTLRSDGPPSKGHRNLDELHFPIERCKVLEESLIHAAKAIEVDGISLVVRSEACEVSSDVSRKSFLKEILQVLLQKILLLPTMMTEPIQESSPDIETKQRELLVEYWKGVLQMEIIDYRNKVIIQFQNSPASQMSSFTAARFLRFNPMHLSSTDEEYWQRALHDLSEDHLSIGSSSQSSTIHSTVGRVKFLLGEFESALLDFDRALKSNTDGLASTLLDRAIVKCALAKFLEAKQDINWAAEINRYSYDIRRFQRCVQDILYMGSSEFESSPSLFLPQEPVPDLLTRDLDSKLFPEMLPPIESKDPFGPPLIPHWTDVCQPLLNLPDLDLEQEISHNHDYPQLENMDEFGLPLIPDWTEVCEPSLDLPDLDLEQEISHSHDFPQLLREYLNLYGLTGYESLRIGEKLAEGGQAEIFKAIGAPPPGTQTNLVLKVFKQAFPSQTLLQPDVFQFGGVYLEHPSPFLCIATGVKFSKSGQCAFVFPRHWGDLRHLIHQQIVKGSLFEFPTVVKIMLQIAEGMRILHIRNILHRDLKASNILVNTSNPDGEDFRCMVADFECSVGVMGTSFWRAPEILTQLHHQSSHPKALVWSKAADVYSFGMLCYEIVTGRTPFAHLKASDWNLVLSRLRPSLPHDLNSELRMLINCCWCADPKQRPDFLKICKVLTNLKGENSLKNCAFKFLLA